MARLIAIAQSLYDALPLHLGYDKFGHRTYIAYGNGTNMSYAYDPQRRWLDSIKTQTQYGSVLQNMSYHFDLVGNILGYDNSAASYETKQSYGYDALYQITSATGTSTKPYGINDYGAPTTRASPATRSGRPGTGLPSTVYPRASSCPADRRPFRAYTGPMKTIRPAHMSDLPYLYRICHDTAADGRGAESLVRDRAMVGHFFVAPYLFHPDGQAFVLTADGLPVGYVAGAANSISFYQWLEADWLPEVRALYATVGEPQSDFETWMLATIRGRPKAPEFLAAWPGHLHINIDAAHRGDGFGRRLFEAWRTKLWARGVPGFHLGVSSGNRTVRNFYESLGLQIIREEPGVVWMAQDNPQMPIRGSTG